jgi:DNA-binding protein H-NS
MRNIIMTKLTVSAQISKLRKERMALEKQEQALINKTYKEAIAQIKSIMKDSGLGLEDLVNYLEGVPAKSEYSTKPSLSSTLSKLGTKSSKADKVGKADRSLKTASKVKSATAKKPSSRAGIKVPIKYQHPTQTQLSWTGRGKMPAWVAELKAAGELEKALVQKA